jgi:uridine kinase
LTELDEVLLSSEHRIDRRALSTLFRATTQHPLHQCLFGRQVDNETILEQRWRGWPSVRRHFETIEEVRVLSPFMMWIGPYAMLQFIEHSSYQTVGLCGPPGAGKTTIAEATACCARAIPTARSLTRLSLDEFHYPLEERLRRRLKWRAQPGSHDLAMAERRLVDLRAAKGARAIFEGWFVGKMDEGYEVVSSQIDYLIYLDCPLGLARRRRFWREEQLRSSSSGREVLSERDMNDFWSELLSPGTEKWVAPLKRKADLIITLNDVGDIVAATLGTPH